MNSYSREWCIALDIQESGEVRLSVRADDRALLPVTVLPSADRLLEHVEAALVDFRQGDSLTGVVRTPDAETKICSASRREVILSWIASTILERA
jgi:hypothetical protein